MSRDMTGADGEDLVLYVPIGTQVRSVETGDLLADLAAEGDRFLLQGGKGGKGNTNFKSATTRTPRYATDGRPGVELELVLELKLIADIGLLGFPNAGKSTFISRVSAAKPKIADYPFTTLVPNLGVVRLAEGSSFVVADIPGLIEGAADGAGLGHQFLKHVERCAGYIHLVALGDAEDSAPVERFQTLIEELRRYDDALLRRPQIVALSKADVVDPASAEAARAELERASGTRVFLLSAVRGDGLREIVAAAWRLVEGARATGEVPDASQARSPLLHLHRGGSDRPDEWDDDGFDDAGDDWDDDAWADDGASDAEE
jgi:GTP-binding protein